MSKRFYVLDGEKFIVKSCEDGECRFNKEGHDCGYPMSLVRNPLERPSDCSFPEDCPLRKESENER